ncbi:aldo/keto reductase [Saccharopolyspora sp. HNM0983]|uniref:Aldo/keto reductase n=1 Tax=Saccharopolyspora montiporae TaxID=2781240 RepID=A0A929BA62_9PSEU|nr:aldo/keto reductase [Saccharopolyspora sp. HNM0983]
MQHRHLGRSGLRVSRIALGTMTWGHDTDTDEAAAQLDAFHEAGGTLVDTADLHHEGRSEHILGDLLHHHFHRDDLVLATRAAPRGPAGTPTSRGTLLTALDTALRRLRTDHIDLWQIPAWDPAVPLDETLGAIDTAVTSGRIRYAGVANHTGWQLATAAQHQRNAPGRTPIIADQVEYSLLERGPDHDTAPAAEHHGTGLLAWAPLGRGVLTGKYRHTTPPDSRAAGDLAAYVDHHRTDRAARITQALATAADGLNAAPAHVALAWIRDRPAVTAPIVGARTASQLTTTLAAEDLTLPPAIRAALDDISAPHPHTDPAPTPL